MKKSAKLRITFHDDRVKHVRISLVCDTDTLMAKIEKWEYRPDVKRVIIVDDEIK